MYRPTLNLWNIGLTLGFLILAVFIISELRYFIYIVASKRPGIRCYNLQ